MVLLRARRTKLSSALRHDNEDDSSTHHVRARQENRRRGALYDVSSPSGKRLPSVCLQPADARVRRDLLRLTQQEINKEKNSIYEDEQNDCKHREHLNYRPPMDKIHKLRDLHTTVAKDCRGQVKLTAEERMFASLQQQFGVKQSGEFDNKKKEWKLGYSNNVDTGSRAGVGGTFEPRDGARERVLDPRSASALLSSSVAIAYPLENPEDERIETDNQAENVKKRIESSHRHQLTKKKPWCPASSSSRYSVEQSSRSPTNSPYQDDYEGLQRFPLRSVEDFEPINVTDADLAINAKCAHKQETLLTKVADTYSRVRARIDRMKDPQLRYELPIEDGTQHRAYRLGLDAVPSTKPKKCKEKPKFRPKSAGTSLGFQTSGSTLKTGDLLSRGQIGGGKVAGARRRPHSANISFLKHSTVYCMGPPTPSKTGCVSTATDFRSVLDVERQKRQRERENTLQKLAKRGLLHNIPLAQVFARLRREGLTNIDRRLQRGIFERMTLEEYMSACGCLNTTPMVEQKQIEVKEIQRFSSNMDSIQVDSSVDSSPALNATRNALVVSRQQFHLALEAFNLSPTDVNLLFSALDLTVSDFVKVWDAICTVERLQHEHTAIRRARVQQLQAPPKDLDFLRKITT